MSARRAGAPRLIDWTGERCVPWAPDVPVVYEHLHRYYWAASLVAGRRVLDLGSGEGFGSAILAESAVEVVGIDIDEPTIEHSRLNYAGPRLRFELGSAVDLTSFEDASFDVVVAFEVIEHVREQDRVLEEAARVLTADGLVIVSTPDRVMYAEGRVDPNPYHERELTLEEFRELLGKRFAHVAAWGQRTITGSHLQALDERREAQLAHEDFFIERAGDEWRSVGPPAALYCVALASNAPLPDVATNSTLADCGLELMRVKERELANSERALVSQREQLAADFEERYRGLRDELERERREKTRLEAQRRAEREQREQDAVLAEADARRHRDVLDRAEHRVLELQHLLAQSDERLAVAAREKLRVEQSVTWQTFQKLRVRLYRAIGGERSRRARLLGASLRFVGRRLRSRSRPPVPPLPAGHAPPNAAGVVQLPEFPNPKVSLVIPVHAHAPLTHACLVSIRDRTDKVPYEVIIVDDTSDEPTLDLLTRVRGARILHNEVNLGFLRSMNRGAGVARGDWIVLFNNDTEVTRGWLSSMVKCAESSSDVGVVTPKFVYPDGSLNEAGGIVWRDGNAWNYGRGDAPDAFQYEYRRETDYGSAAALMVKAEFWRTIGGFDERYAPIYYEDTDVCFQAREHGLRVLYEPEAVVVHVEGATSGTDVSSGAKRHQEENRHRFVEKWSDALERQRHFSLPNVRIAADRFDGPHVLVIDHRVPMPDRDSGSLRIMGIMKALIGLGARVTFIPENLAPVQPYTRALQRMGVEVLYGNIEVRDELRVIGPRLRLAVLSRPHAASRWLDTVREFAPTATVAYDTVDLHWLREARRGASEAESRTVASNGSFDLDAIVPKAKALRELELALIRATDATLVVTEGERLQVENDVPGTNVLVIPNIHDIDASTSDPAGRSGILFVGGFEHVPNVDAAVRLVKEVMPEVWAELGDVEVTIAGPSAPIEVESLASPLVNVVGWVEDLRPLLRRSRLLVAPLRYGAGMKGKVTQCLAAGLPVVTTSIGAEGLADPGSAETAEANGLLVGDETHELAQATIRAYREDELWRRLSRAGMESIKERCSTEIVSGRLEQLLAPKRAKTARGEAQRV